jgi:GNAT superfamily N-acetyltransferase
MTASAPDAITFRAARPDDAVCLGVLSTQVFLDTYATQGIRPAIAREARQCLSEEVFAEILAHPRSAILLAEIAGHQVGFAQLTHDRTHALLPPEARAAELNRLYVLRPFLGKGIGKELLARTEILARAQGADLLWLTAWTGNAHALRFYEAQRYQDAGGSVYTFEGDTYETRLFLKHLSR